MTKNKVATPFQGFTWVRDNVLCAECDNCLDEIHQISTGKFFGTDPFRGNQYEMIWVHDNDQHECNSDLVIKDALLDLL